MSVFTYLWVVRHTSTTAKAFNQTSAVFVQISFKMIHNFAIEQGH